MAVPAAFAPPASPAAPPPRSLAGGFLWAARLSARQFLTGPRKWVILLAGAVFPGLLSVFVFAQKAEMVHPFLQLFDQLYLQGVMLFIALLGAIPAFSSDVEDGTVVYLFSRPTPRPVIVAGKWLGAMLPLVVLSLLPVLAAWPLALRQQQPYWKTIERWEAQTASAGESGGGGPGVAGERGPGPGAEGRRPAPPRPAGDEERKWVKVSVTKFAESSRDPARAADLCMALAATALGVLEYGTLFYVLGVVFSRPYMVSLAYAVIFEVIIGRAPVKLYVISKLVRGAAVRLMDPVPRFFVGSLETVPTAFTCWLALAVIPLVLLGAAGLVASRKSFVSKGI